MDDISIYNNASIIWLRKIPSKIIIWLILVILGLIGITLIFFFFSYNKTQIFSGIIREDIISILVKEEEIDNLINKKLLINNNEQTYTITKISDDYYIDNNVNYREVDIKTSIPTSHLINNNIIELKFIINTTTLYKQLKERIKKGMI